MKKSIMLLSIVAVCSLNSLWAVANDHMDHSNHSRALPEVAVSESMTAYLNAMDHMHKPMMDGIMDPDPDVAFIKGMIPHHQGAIDMARIQLKYGTDQKLRELSEEIIRAQEEEIAFMEGWLKERQSTK